MFVVTRSLPVGARAILCAMLALVVGAPAAHAARELDAAKQAYADVDYARCRDKAQAALAQPATRSERVDAWRLAGLCAAAVGETDDAREAFRIMLAIDHDARLPDGLSPRFTSAFREAKGSLVGTAPLALSVDSDVVEEGARTLRIKLSDGFDVVTRIAWRGPAGTLSSPLRRAELLELEVPVGAPVEVVGLDRAGGEVVVLAVQQRAAPPPRTAALDDKPAESSEPASPLPWIVAASVAGGVVVLGGITAGVVLALQPPSSVNFKTDVVFGSP